MRVALVTASKLPRPDTDLAILVDAFSARGIAAEIRAWDDPSVAWSMYDVALVRSTWNYVEQLDAFETWIDRTARVTTIANPRAALRWNLHKSYLIELARAGIPVVPTEVLHACDEADWHTTFDRYGTIVVKPAVSAGSFATIRVMHGDASTARAHRASYPGRDFLVQPLLASVVEHGESNLIYLDGIFSHGIHKGARWDGEPEQSRGLIEPEADELLVAEQVLSVVAAKGFGPLAYARVDIARGTEGAPMLMELEIVEPSLFLDRAPDRANLLVDAISRGLQSSAFEGE